MEPSSPSARMRIAVCQLHAQPNDVDANVERIRHVLRACAGDSMPHLVVFAETFLQGYHIGIDALIATAEPVPTPSDIGDANSSSSSSSVGRRPLVEVALLARHYGIAVLLPFAELSTESMGDGSMRPQVYNSSVLFDADGSVVSVYRKTHLWGSSYEKRAFASGPGRRLAHVPSMAHALDLPKEAAKNDSAALLTPTVWGQPRAQLEHCYDPFTPVTLRAFPHIPLGLLICFDLEFPEPCRVLAARGAKVIISTHASGEAAGFTSTHFVPVRATENDAIIVYCNYPSSPVPEPPQPLPGAISVSYSGGSAVCGPDGGFLYALPVYACNRAKAAPHAPAEAISSSAYDAASSDAVMKALQPSLRPDEAVFIVSVDPFLPVYQSNRQRNPYLVDRRADLCGSMTGKP